MTEKKVLIPGPHHPISIVPCPSRVVVKFGGEVIADTKEALLLHQPTTPMRYLIPQKDIKMNLMERSEKMTYCPYKGDVSYFSIKSGDASSANAAFCYEAPYDAVAAMKDRLGFYPEKVELIVEEKTS